MIDGTPAITMTLPIQKPGAPDTLFATSAAPCGNARHAHARLVQLAAGLGMRSFRIATASRMMSIGTPNALATHVGGDVVMGRADAAGGEDIGVARAQRIDRRDDRLLVVGDHPHFLQVDADGGEIVGDVADILVLGAARQDLVADDEHRRGDELWVSIHDGHGILPGPVEHLAWRR